MLYVALLRGINVGGKRRVEMKRLRAVFERAGMDRVQTYINSGNVIFENDSLTPKELTETLAAAIEAEFGFRVDLLVRDSDTIKALASALPDGWVNDQTAKCDVLFLWDGLDDPRILERLTIKPGIDDARYAHGAVLWRVERPNVTRSGLMRLVGTEEYARMTVRNCNTLRRLARLMEGI